MYQRSSGFTQDLIQSVGAPIAAALGITIVGLAFSYGIAEISGLNDWYAKKNETANSVIILGFPKDTVVKTTLYLSHASQAPNLKSSIALTAAIEGALADSRLTKSEYTTIDKLYYAYAAEKGMLGLNSAHSSQIESAKHSP